MSNKAITNLFISMLNLFLFSDMNNIKYLAAMRQQHFTTLTDHLQKLKNSAGFFIIQTSNTVSGKPIFCQLLKTEVNSETRFEALSHYFEKSISPSLENKFSEMGFKLEKGENYVKFIDLNSETNIHVATREIVQIFEDIYGVGNDGKYNFESEIY